MASRIAAKSAAQCNDKVELVLSNEGALWLSNPGARKIEIGPGELCGFNMGTISDKPLSGVCFCIFFKVNSKVKK